MNNIHENIHQLSQLLGIQEDFLPTKAPSTFDIDPALDCTLIKGDNLLALATLLLSHSGKIDFCYIDPPYNTGSKFIYEDNRRSQTSGIWGVHASWMSFMLPRLAYMRELLSETGIVAISIDDYEYAQLKIMMDLVFGANHHFGTVIVNRSTNGKGSKAHIASSHEYVLIYGKTNKAKLLGLPEEDFSSYDKEDPHGRFKIDGLFRKKGEASRRSDRPNMFYPLYYDTFGNVFTEKTNESLKEALPLDSNGVERRWLWGLEKAKRDSWRLYASAKGVIYVKNYLTTEKRIKVRSIWDDPRYLTQRATSEITKIYGEKIFETPKPIGLIEDLIKCSTSSNALILDYFCGTGTTAHAANNVNRTDGGCRKVILVEENAKVSKTHIAHLKGFTEISKLAEFRLKKIAEGDKEYIFESLSMRNTT